MAARARHCLHAFLLRCQKGVARLWEPKDKCKPGDHRRQRAFKAARRDRRRWGDRHSAAFAALYLWRDRTARELDDGPHYLCSVETLVAVAQRLPPDLAALRSVQLPLSPALGDGGNALGAALLRTIKDSQLEYKKSEEVYAQKGIDRQKGSSAGKGGGSKKNSDSETDTTKLSKKENIPHGGMMRSISDAISTSLHAEDYMKKKNDERKSCRLSTTVKSVEIWLKAHQQPVFMGFVGGLLVLGGSYLLFPKLFPKTRVPPPKKVALQ